MQTTTTNTITNTTTMDGIIIRFENDQMIVTSLQVAKDFSKRHDHVLRDIEELKDVPNFGEMFHLTNIPDTYENYGKQYQVTLIVKIEF